MFYLVFLNLEVEIRILCKGEVVLGSFGRVVGKRGSYKGYCFKFVIIVGKWKFLIRGISGVDVK